MILEDIYLILLTGTNEIDDFNNLIFYLALRKFEFDDNFLAVHRSNFGFPVIENIVKENKEKSKLKKKFKKSEKSEKSEKFEKYEKSEKEINSLCDPKSPICLNDIENDFQHNVISYICLRAQSNLPKIIDNYFIAAPFLLFEEIDDDSTGQNEGLLIERRPHTCRKNSESDLDDESEAHSMSYLSEGWVQKFDEITSMEMTRGYNWDYTKVLDTIKQDQNFERANKTMVMSFTPRPFLDIDGN